MKEEKYNPFNDYSDVIEWLADIAAADFIRANSILEDPFTATGRAFGLTAEGVENLVNRSRFEFPSGEKPIVVFYNEHLRRIRDFRL